MDVFAPAHLLILGVVAMMFFGWRRMPDMSRSLGRSLRIFKSEISSPVDSNSPDESADPRPAAHLHAVDDPHPSAGDLATEPR
jgi:sec-independent protein translocase protein TatA